MTIAPTYSHTVFTAHYDPETGKKTVTADRWPDEQRVTPELIGEGSNHIISRSGDLITIAVANGGATYEITDEDERYLTIRLISGTIAEERPPNA